ncbi:hypothetical protein, partial [Bradyrhizobium uaiense]|uniref:hypothetical protein n=1 Tax=Bradyrhizobium uaiense TaxID=2594946 RepID=UPI0019D638EC
GETSERKVWSKANHGVNCDSDLMPVFAPSVNPAPCTKYAEEPLIVALYHDLVTRVVAQSIAERGQSKPSAAVG